MLAPLPARLRPLPPLAGSRRNVARARGRALSAASAALLPQARPSASCAAPPWRHACCQRHASAERGSRLRRHLSRSRVCCASSHAPHVCVVVSSLQRQRKRADAAARASSQLAQPDLRAHAARICAQSIILLVTHRSSLPRIGSQSKHHACSGSRRERAQRHAARTGVRRRRVRQCTRDQRGRVLW